MKKAFSYQRWSTAMQGVDGKDSRIRQTHSAEKWIQEHGKTLGYELAKETFIDSGKSGFKGEHIEKDDYGKAKGELAKFIERVQNGSIKNDSILLVDDFSRFSRLKPTKSITLFMQVIDSGIGLVFTGSYEKRVINAELIDKEPHILSFIIGEMIRSYTESAERSRKIISAKSDKKTRMQNGEIVAHNNIPKYFSYIPITKSNGRYIHNDNTEIVRELVKGIIEGKSLYAMADSLNARNVKTFRKGYQWSGNSIRQILRNRILIGEYLGNKDFVPPIIDEETFKKIKNILDGHKKFRGNRGEVLNIFRGICFCADSDCGKSMTIQAQKSKDGKSYLESGYRYLRCSVTGKHVACKNRKHIQIGGFELEFFTDYLMKNPTALIGDSDSKELKELNKQITEKTSELNGLTADIKKLSEAFRTVPIDELGVQLPALNKQRDRVKGELDALTSKVSSVQDAPEAFNHIQQTVLGIDIKKGVRYLLDKGLIAETKSVWKYNQEIIKKMQKNELVEKVKAALADNYVREGMRVLIPQLVGKITADTNKGQFFIYNRMGKLVYESTVYKSNRNTSQKWREALKKWTTRKVNGKIIKVNRKAS